MPDIPHFSFPFSFSGSNLHAREVEQDSIDDITSCIAAVVVTEIGQRYELPDFGVADPTFIEGGMDPDDLLEVVAEWEPRAILGLEENWDFDTFTQNLRLTVDEEGI